MDLEQIKSLTDADMEAVNAYIRKHLSSPVALIESMAEYIIASGGKRLRPMLAVLAARACGYQGEKHAHVAAVVEFIHTATLLHDDVVHLLLVVVDLLVDSDGVLNDIHVLFLLLLGPLQNGVLVSLRFS